MYTTDEQANTTLSMLAGINLTYTAVFPYHVNWTNCSSRDGLVPGIDCGGVGGVGEVTPEPPLSIVVTTTLLYVLIFVVGVLGNLLVIVVVLRVPDMKNSTNLFLVNLSVADLLVLLVCMPTALIDIYAKEHWYFGHAMCKLVPFLGECVALASVLTIIAISYERYYAICHPLKARYVCTILQMLKFVVVIWVVAGIAASPFLHIAIYKNSRLRDGTQVKVCRMPLMANWRKVYVVLLTAVFYVIPFMLLSVVYSLISRNLTRSVSTRESRLTEMVNCSVLKRKHRCRKQVILMLSLVVLLFFLCVLPGRFILVWAAFATKSDLLQLGFEGYLAMTYSARILLYLNSAVNPIIYNLISTKFQIAFRVTLGLRINRRGTLSRNNTAVGKSTDQPTINRSGSSRSSYQDQQHKDLENESKGLTSNNKRVNVSLPEGNSIKLTRLDKCDLYS